MFDYVGSEEIRLAVVGYPRGTTIGSIADLKNWLRDTSDRMSIERKLVIATFVIDLDGNLLLADRHSEHVACAGGAAVLSAGEIFISWDRYVLEISDISNQSTGYCPDLDSWQYVEVALSKIAIDRPSSFTMEFIFRRCGKCDRINIIKDNVFVCAVCDSPLPERVN
jgi:hypothetical protein